MPELHGSDPVLGINRKQTIGFREVLLYLAMQGVTLEMRIILLFLDATLLQFLVAAGHIA